MEAEGIPANVLQGALPGSAYFKPGTREEEAHTASDVAFQYSVRKLGLDPHAQQAEISAFAERLGLR